MLDRISPAVKEYLVCCLPIANIVAHKRAEAAYLHGIAAAASAFIGQADRFPQAIKAANTQRDSFHRSYKLGLATQAVLAIGSLALALFFAPSVPVVAALALFSFACFGISSSVSLPAYSMQGNFSVSVA